MSQAMRFLVSMIMASVLWLAGCGVQPTIVDDPPPVGSIIHRDFACPTSGKLGPVTIKPSWPMAGNTQQTRIYPGSTLGQFLVKNEGQKPARIERVLKILMLGSTLTNHNYRVLARGSGWLGWITPDASRNGDGSVEWTVLENTDATIIGGGEEVMLDISLASSFTNQPDSGDTWHISMLAGGLIYGTVPTCAGAEEAHDLKAEGLPTTLGQIVNTKF